MRPTALTLLALAASLTVPGAAQPPPTVELTPFVGFVFGGDFEDRFDDDSRFAGVDIEASESYGALLDFSVTRSFQIELLYSRQDTTSEVEQRIGRDDLDVRVEYFHLGALYQWTPGQLVPYVAGSFGATNFGLGDDDETRFSWTFGGGVKALVSDHVGFRLDGRFYSTFIEEDDDEVFCSPDYCVTFEDATLFFQWDVKAGIVIGF